MNAQNTILKSSRLLLKYNNFSANFVTCRNFLTQFSTIRSAIIPPRDLSLSPAQPTALIGLYNPTFHKIPT